MSSMKLIAAQHRSEGGGDPPAEHDVWKVLFECEKCGWLAFRDIYSDGHPFPEAGGGCAFCREQERSVPY